MKAHRLVGAALRAIITAAGVTVFVFLVLRLVPGDPVDLMLGEGATPASREALRISLGLNDSIINQFGHFVSELAHGEIGTSLTLHKPVTALIAETLPFTVWLALATTLFANLIGIPAGALMAFYSPARTRAPTRSKFRVLWWELAFIVSILVASIPVFWLGPLLVIALALHWPWLPVSSLGETANVMGSALVLPMLTMGLGLAAFVAQTTRAAVAESLHADYIRTAYAKGLGRYQVLFFHALPAAAVPVITASALQLGHLLAGAVIIEMLFDWPGLGKLTYDAILQRDYATVQGSIFVIALIYVVINMFTDVLNARLGPEHEK